MTFRALSAIRYTLLAWSAAGVVSVLALAIFSPEPLLGWRNWDGVELGWQVAIILWLMACSVALDRSIHGLAPSLVAAVAAGWMSRATMGVVRLPTPNWLWGCLMVLALAVLAVHCWYALGLGARAWGLLLAILACLVVDIAVSLVAADYTPVLLLSVSAVFVAPLVASRRPLWL